MGIGTTSILLPTLKMYKLLLYTYIYLQISLYLRIFIFILNTTRLVFSFIEPLIPYISYSVVYFNEILVLNNSNIFAIKLASFSVPFGFAIKIPLCVFYFS